MCRVVAGQGHRLQVAGAGLLLPALAHSVLPRILLVTGDSQPLGVMMLNTFTWAAAHQWCWGPSME